MGFDAQVLLMKSSRKQDSPTSEFQLFPDKGEEYYYFCIRCFGNRRGCLSCFYLARFKHVPINVFQIARGKSKSKFLMLANIGSIYARKRYHLKQYLLGFHLPKQRYVCSFISCFYVCEKFVILCSPISEPFHVSFLNLFCVDRSQIAAIIFMSDWPCSQLCEIFSSYHITFCGFFWVQ